MLNSEELSDHSPTLPFVDYYANAIRVDPGQCWRMVNRGSGYRMGSPTDCSEPVTWMGRAMVGKKRMSLRSCDGHVKGLEDARQMTDRD